MRIHKWDEEGKEGVEVSDQHSELFLYLQLRIRGIPAFCFHLLLLYQHTFCPLSQLLHQWQEVAL